MRLRSRVRGYRPNSFVLGLPCVGLVFEGWRGGRASIRVRFCLGATGGLMIAAPACSDAGTDHDLRVPCLREGCLRLRLVELGETEAWGFLEL